MNASFLVAAPPAIPGGVAKTQEMAPVEQFSTPKSRGSLCTRSAPCPMQLLPIKIRDSALSRADFGAALAELALCRIASLQLPCGRPAVEEGLECRSSLGEPQSKRCFPHARTSKVVQSQDKLASKHVLIWNCGRDMFLVGQTSVLGTTAVVPAALVIQFLLSGRQNKNAQSTSPHTSPAVSSVLVCIFWTN